MKKLLWVLCTAALMVALKFGSEWTVNYLPAGIERAKPNFLAEYSDEYPVEPTSTAVTLHGGGITTMTAVTWSCGDGDGQNLSYSATSGNFSCGTVSYQPSTNTWTRN